MAGNPVTTPRTVTIQVSDGIATSSPVSATISFGQPATPSLSGFGGTLTYTKGGPQLPFAANTVASEVGGLTLSSATVKFTNWQAGDRIGFFNSAALQYTFTEDLVAHTSVLTLVGTRSLADYQTELRSLQFFNVAGAPNTTTRVVSLQVSSNGLLSNIVSENIAFNVAAAP